MIWKIDLKFKYTYADEGRRNFILLLILFTVFRALTLLAYRPGGLILDFSDFYWYREFAQLSRQGYIPYQNIWTTYPPLFPLLMLQLWKLSALFPPWNQPNLIFSLLLGGVFLLFEIGNFILLYLIALKIYPPEKAFKPAWIYAALFTPVYTLTGWFESYPLFFFLLSLYLLLRGKPYLSAFFTGVGDMIKLIPLILLPVGIKLLEIRDWRLKENKSPNLQSPISQSPNLQSPISLNKSRLRIPALNIDANLKQAGLYLFIFIATVAGIGLPFYRLNPNLIFGSVQITAARAPWETVWALLEGNYAYGVIPLDMRNLAWQPADGPGSSLPWLWITLAFGLLYAFLYTRRVNWRDPKIAVAFTGLTVSLFFLYSKGYSPQWLGWLLIFTSLLLPNLRGVLYAVVLSFLNIIEANLFFPIFPQEHWLLAAVVLLRTALIIALAIEFSLIVWPKLATPALLKTRRYLLLTGLTLLLLATLPAGLRLKTAYFQTRLEQSQYRAAISWLREQPVTEAILMNDQAAYDWFYPYLRRSHQFYMLDDYADANTTVEAKTARLLNDIAARHQALWIFDADPAHTTPAEAAAFKWLSGLSPAHQSDIDGGRLYLFIFETK